ncbi:MAG: shikimate dehydrogenase [Thermodesulfobacteriota bacterium]
MNINAQTALYCVMGNPVGHSLSPAMHNAAFAHLGLNAVYLAFRIEDVKQAMNAMRTLPILGASVTIPHKLGVMEHLDHVDEIASRMGAVNTILNRDGKLYGTNTDGPGAAMALEAATPLAGKRVLVLGSGGVARAIALSVADRGSSVTVAHRPEDKAEAERLARDLGCSLALLLDASGIACDVAVNATPVGMHPDVDASPVPASFFKPGMTAMDAVYNPLATRFLKDAAAAGCVTVGGAEMFIYQGAAQLSLWTGREAPVDLMRGIVLTALKQRQGK